MTIKNTLQSIMVVLDDIKAVDTRVIDVKKMTSVTDYMIIVSGTSSRHVKSIADKVIAHAKKNNLPLLGVEGIEESEWVLIDLGDIIVHIMQPPVREYYQLERLWSTEIQTSTPVPES